MSLPPVIRVFFAVQVPDEIKQQIAAFSLRLREKIQSKVIRWSKIENLHITLQFLAKANSQDLPQLIDCVWQKIQAVPAFNLQLGDIQLFPHPFRPRVIVLMVLPHEPLATLAGLVAQGLESAHYTLIDKPFRGHLTLGRIKVHDKINLNFITQLKPIVVPPIRVSNVVLFRSEPQPEGSIYTILHKLPLMEN
jgi:RNA 2',3'-cyclic 3'-phosphodiesterase